MNPRKGLDAFLPPFLARRLRSYFGAVRFHGDYPDWDAAKAGSRGYDAGSILEKVEAATLEVKEGRAAFERDSITFDRIEYSWPVLAALLWIANRRGGLRVLDFGGALGSSWYQNRGFLQGLDPLRWSVVEQPHFVDCGKRRFEDAHLRFFSDIGACVAAGKPDVALFSSVLNYLPKPFETLEGMIATGVDHLIVDRTPFLDGPRDRITVQTVSKRIYPATYPAWFFSRSKFLAFFQGRYELVSEFDSLDRANIPSRYLGFFFRRIGAA